MLTDCGHFTYCTNIHPGENWQDHFNEIKNNFPGIKSELAPSSPMGLGLRLANIASKELIGRENLKAFKDWLHENNAYVFTINGFPYGSFHKTRVKDLVHTPDWTTRDRVDYTIRLFEILKELLPPGMDGGVSTSPLGYKLWYKNEDQLEDAKGTATANIISVAERLIEINNTSGKLLHLDIEPEPDGMLETGEEFIQWYQNDLLPKGAKTIASKFNVSISAAEDLLREHMQLCYDVCHFAIGYEDHEGIAESLRSAGIKIGKIQISAALKGMMNQGAVLSKEVREGFAKFNEPVYLHQVVAKKVDGSFIRYPDLPEALEDFNNSQVREWRAHFHVPVFAENFGALQSTQSDIANVLQIQKEKKFSNHLEVETYTWDVLPPSLKLPIQQSIVRELKWVLPYLQTK